MVKVFIEKERKNIEVEFNGSVKDLIETVGVNIEEVIVIKNDVLVTEDEFVSEDDNIKLLSVVSGG